MTDFDGNRKGLEKLRVFGSTLRFAWGGILARHSNVPGEKGLRAFSFKSGFQELGFSMVG